MRSAVAGLSKVNSAFKPSSLRAAAIASLIAKKTVVARPKGGSPTACCYSTQSPFHVTKTMPKVFVKNKTEFS